MTILPKDSQFSVRCSKVEEGLACRRICVIIGDVLRPEEKKKRPASEKSEVERGGGKSK
jgi:hypothetical protein